MNGLNKVYLIGNLGHDPELRATGSGMAVLKVSVATPGRKKVGDTWVDEPDWHRVTLFSREAEFVGKYGRKGDPLAVECALRPRKWTDKEGRTHHEVDLVAERVCWLGSRRGTATDARPPAPPSEPDGGEATEEPIPF